MHMKCEFQVLSTDTRVTSRSCALILSMVTPSGRARDRSSVHMSERLIDNKRVNSALRMRSHRDIDRISLPTQLDPATHQLTKAVEAQQHSRLEFLQPRVRPWSYALRDQHTCACWPRDSKHVVTRVPEREGRKQPGKVQRPGFRVSARNATATVPLSQRRAPPTRASLPKPEGDGPSSSAADHLFPLPRLMRSQGSQRRAACRRWQQSPARIA